MRILFILVALGVTSSAMAQDVSGWHLALETSLVSLKRTSGGRSGDFVRAEQDTLQLASAESFGLRVGYLWPRGWELGALLDVGGLVSTWEAEGKLKTARLSPLAYVRYLFSQGRFRPYAGANFGVDLVRSRTDGDVDLTTNAWCFGPELGVRMLVTDWLSLDPFVRAQFDVGSTTLSTRELERDFDERSWRVLIGFAVSFWLPTGSRS